MKLASPAKTARGANLRYISDREPGIVRRRIGPGFRYLDARSKRPVTSRVVIARIGALAIPPAWERVWICADPDGHLQATGYDERGRKQYRYHAEWSSTRNLAKFDGMPRFGHALAGIRRRIRRDQRLQGMPKEKVVACVVMLLDETLVRIGNAEYARNNSSYGLTTIRNHHATVRGDQVRLTFKAKSGRQCDIRLESPRAARIIRHCQQLPGQELFGYVDDDGRARDVGSADVNDYLLAVTGEGFTAKDFRTWGGTVIAAAVLNGFGPPVRVGHNGAQEPLTARELKRREVAAVSAAAAALSNTPATCRKYYIHPGLLGAYADGSLTAAFRAAQASATPRELRPQERAVLALLKRLSRPAAGQRGGNGVVKRRSAAAA